MFKHLILSKKHFPLPKQSQIRTFAGKWDKSAPKLPSNAFMLYFQQRSKELRQAEAQKEPIETPSPIIDTKAFLPHQTVIITNGRHAGHEAQLIGQTEKKWKVRVPHLASDKGFTRQNKTYDGQVKYYYTHNLQDKEIYLQNMQQQPPPKIQMKHFMKSVGQEWKTLSLEEKAPYLEIEKISKAHYRKALEEHRKERKVVNHFNGIPPSKTAYLCFCTKRRNEIKSQTIIKSMHHGRDIMRLLAKEWGALTEEDKIPYKHEAMLHKDAWIIQVNKQRLENSNKTLTKKKRKARNRALGAKNRNSKADKFDLMSRSELRKAAKNNKLKIFGANNGNADSETIQTALRNQEQNIDKYGVEIRIMTPNDKDEDGNVLPGTYRIDTINGSMVYSKVEAKSDADENSGTCVMPDGTPCRMTLNGTWFKSDFDKYGKGKNVTTKPRHRKNQDFSDEFGIVGHGKDSILQKFTIKNILKDEFKPNHVDEGGTDFYDQGKSMVETIIPMFEDNYSYVINTTTSTRVLIDPAEPKAVKATLNRLFTEIPRGLDSILTTHKHLDHTSGNFALSQMYSGRFDTQEFSSVSEHVVKVYGPTNDGVIPSITHPVQGGDIIVLSNNAVRVQVLNTPFHTSGHISYLAEKRGT